MLLILLTWQTMYCQEIFTDNEGDQLSLHGYSDYHTHKTTRTAYSMYRLHTMKTNQRNLKVPMGIVYSPDVQVQNVRIDVIDVSEMKITEIHQTSQ